MHIREQDPAIGARAHRSDAKRRAHHLAIDQHRPREPFVATGRCIEALHPSERAVAIQTHEMRAVIRAHEDFAARDQAARKWRLAFGKLRPGAVTAAAAKFAGIDDRKHGSVIAGGQSPHPAASQLLAHLAALDDKEAIGPSRNQNCRARHCSPLRGATNARLHCLV
jgi:hypothetical protein